MSTLTHARTTRHAITLIAGAGLAAALVGGFADAASATPSGGGITRTAWQMQDHPAAPFLLSGSYPHGDIGEYAYASVPAVGDSGWVAAPNPDSILYGPGSRLWNYPCQATADYSYFQSYVYVPAGTTPTGFGLQMSVDDGARVTIYNADYPGGVTPSQSYIYLGLDRSTGDLSSYLRSGSNRVVVTQVDDCWSGSYLFGATILTGNDPVPIGYGWDGFLQPINDTAHHTGEASSIFKAGSTVPVKFQLRNADGTLATPGTAPLFVQPLKGGSLAASATVDETNYSDPGTNGGEFKYDATSQQWIYNWKTAKGDAGFWYRIGVALPDGSKQFVSIGLK